MFQRLKDKIDKYIEKTESKIWVYNAIIWIEISALTILVSVEFLMGYEHDGILAMSILWIYLVVMAVLANKYHEKIQLFYALIVAPVNLIVFPFMFLWAEGGGIESGMPVWLTFGLYAL